MNKTISKLVVICAALLFGFSGITNAVAQTSKVPRFGKIPVPNTNCFVYMPTNQTEQASFTLDYSEDSSKVYTADVEGVDSIHYAVIFIDLIETADSASQEAILISYLDILKEHLEISSAAGYGKGHRSERNPKAIGVIDYWRDKSELNFEIKGWIDHKFIAIMLVYGKKDINFNVGQMFKNGVVFDESKF